MATLIVCFLKANETAIFMYFMRFFNGFALFELRPIEFNIIADRFDLSHRMRVTMKIVMRMRMVMMLVMKILMVMKMAMMKIVMVMIT